MKLLRFGEVPEPDISGVYPNFKDSKRFVTTKKDYIDYGKQNLVKAILSDSDFFDFDLICGHDIMGPRQTTNIVVQ